MALEKQFLKKVPQQSRSKAMVAVIMEAVERLVDKEGAVSEFSAENVAKLAGVGVGTIYDYFKDRDGVFGTFLARITERNFSNLERIFVENESRPLPVLFEVMIRATFDVYFQNERRSRAAIITLFRLGWTGPTVREKDRFSQLLENRLHIEFPHLSRAQIHEGAMIFVDALLGVILFDLFRMVTPEAKERHIQLVVRHAIATLEHLSQLVTPPPVEKTVQAKQRRAKRVSKKQTRT